MEEDHQNIENVVSSVCYNAYTLLININMWYDVIYLRSIPMRCQHKKTISTTNWDDPKKELYFYTKALFTILVCLAAKFVLKMSKQ